MKDVAKAAAGWMPVGQHVAGTRDAATGERQAQPVPVTLASAVRQLSGIVMAAAVIATLYFGQNVLVPITLAVMLSFILSPMVNLLQRLRIWRAPAVILTVLAALGAIGAIGTLIGTQAASLSVNAPQYAGAIEAKVQAFQAMAAGRIDAVTKALGGGRKPTRAPARAPESRTLTAAADALTAPRRPVLVEVAPPKTTPLTVARTILQPIIGPLETTFIVLMVAVFVLLQKEDLRDRFIRVFGANDLHRTTMALDDAGKRLSRYFIAQLAVNTAFGVVIGIALWMFGVPSPAMWGVLSGLLRFVPYIGPVLAAVAPVALGAAIDPGWSTAILIALTFVVIESIIGYVVEPLLYGHSTGLSPVSVIVSAIFWTFLWGPVGLVMSTPLTLCFVVLGRHVKALEFFDVVLGDRPALTPVEGFYQRILAGNPDEALAQAETMLADNSLLDYYADVVLGALRLAALDEAKGTIDRAQIDRMNETMRAVLDDLDHHDAADMNSEQPPITIACITGSGSFDESVSTMLGQILTRRGYAVRVIRHQAAARGAIADLDLTGVDIIALTYLELAGSPAQLRFLVRRLRQKSPSARLVVGLWAQGEAALGDVSTQNALGADAYVSSLGEACAAVEETGRDMMEPAAASR